MSLNDSPIRSAILSEEGVSTTFTGTTALPKRFKNNRSTQAGIKKDLINKTKTLFRQFKRKNGGV